MTPSVRLKRGADDGSVCDWRRGCVFGILSERGSDVAAYFATSNVLGKALVRKEGLSGAVRERCPLSAPKNRSSEDYLGPEPWLAGRIP